MYYPIIVSAFQNPLRKSNFSLAKDKKTESLEEKRQRRGLSILSLKKGELIL